MKWNEQNRRVLYGFRSKESKDAMEDLPLLYAMKLSLQSSRQSSYFATCTGSLIANFVFVCHHGLQAKKKPGTKAKHEMKSNT